MEGFFEWQLHAWNAYISVTFKQFLSVLTGSPSAKKSAQPKSQVST